jgi:hypothetical protein
MGDQARMIVVKGGQQDSRKAADCPVEALPPDQVSCFNEGIDA